LTDTGEDRPDYGNWAPKRLIYGTAVVGLVFTVISIWFLLLVFLGILLLSFSAYLAYVRFKFSASGGDIQRSVWELVLKNLEWNGEGRALDIGCGNGPLAIMLAKRYPSAQVVGIDFWGKTWEYSREYCERNAGIEGVDERVTFQQASASSLPFADGHFDAAVSNFVFHDVMDVRDKREVIREALRVVRKGGSFSFQDEFLAKSLYGDPDELLEAIRGWGIDEVVMVRTCDEDFVPRLLKAPMFLGTMAILAGRK
jgi:ubiquinone/menaquinone biosynthesis C-methylase UbiE